MTLARDSVWSHPPAKLHKSTPAALPESLSGLIERVTFFNEDNGFAVLQVKVNGRRDLVTVVGSLPAVSAGEWIHTQGHWIQDREFGLQFRGDAHDSLMRAGAGKLLLVDDTIVVQALERTLASSAVVGKTIDGAICKCYAP